MNKENKWLLPQYAILLFFTAVFLYPIVWLAINSLKTNDELFSSPWALPSAVAFGNYVRAIVVGNIGRYFVNSVIVSVSVVALTTLFGAMAAYGIARLKWKGAKFTLSLFLAGIMIPTHSTIIPLFYVFQKTGLYNNYVAVVLPHLVFALPMAVFILSGFFSAIPRELEEAAIMDGYSLIQAFFRVIWPVTAPSLVTVAVITFIPAWNDLLFPQIFLSDPNKMTLPVGLTTFMGRYSTDYVGMIAAIIITIIPSIVVYSLLHERIIEGMTAGAVKG